MPNEIRSAFELLEAEVHAGIAQGRKGALDASLAHHGVEVAQLATGEAQKLAVGTVRCSVEPALCHEEQRLRASLDPLAQSGARLFRGDDGAKVVAQPIEEPRVHSRFADELHAREGMSVPNAEQC
jgi:hypothetical protein